MTSNAGEFRIVITALDKATLTLMEVKSKFSSTFAHMKRDVEPITGSVGLLGNSLKNLADESGLTTVARHAGVALSTVGHLVGSVLRLGTSLAGLASVASFGGLLEMAKSGAEDMASLGEAAEKTGTTMERLARLRYGAKQSGIDEPGKMDTALVRLNKSIADAASGQGKPQLAYFRAMHISLHDSKGHLRSAADVWAQLSDAFKHNGNIAQETRAAIKLLGKSGADMIPFLIKGAKYADDMGEEFDRLHGPIDSANYKIGKEAVEAWRKLDVATQGLKDSIAVDILPTITSLLTPLTDWIAKNRELIATKIGEYIRDVGNWLKNIDWQKVGAGALQFAQAFKTAIYAVRDAVLFVKGVFDWIRNNWGFIHTVMDIATFGAMSASESMQKAAEARAKVAPEQRNDARSDASARQAYYAAHAFHVPPVVAQLLGIKPSTASAPSSVTTSPLPKLPAEQHVHGTPLGVIAQGMLNALRSSFSINVVHPDKKTIAAVRAMPRPQIVRPDARNAGSPRAPVHAAVVHLPHTAPSKPNKGELDVKVAFSNVPQGTKVTADPRGNAIDKLNVGLAWQH